MEDGVTYVSADIASRERFTSLRRSLGVTTFGLNLMSLDPGQRGRIHRHEHQEEVYLVLEGHVRVTVEREPYDLGPFDALRVAPALRREVSNPFAERALLIAMGGAHAHEGRDGRAFASWDDTQPRLPSELPLPPDLPVPRDIPVPPDIPSS
jgi:mannose-6-phosphate isomerase-like protein (cupin superfamily)